MLLQFTTRVLRFLCAGNTYPVPEGLDRFGVEVVGLVTNGLLCRGGGYLVTVRNYCSAVTRTNGKRTAHSS